MSGLLWLCWRLAGELPRGRPNGRKYMIPLVVVQISAVFHITNHYSPPQLQRLSTIHNDCGKDHSSARCRKCVETRWETTKHVWRLYVTAPPPVYRRSRRDLGPRSSRLPERDASRRSLGAWRIAGRRRASSCPPASPRAGL